MRSGSSRYLASLVQTTGQILQEAGHQQGAAVPTLVPVESNELIQLDLIRLQRYCKHALSARSGTRHDLGRDNS